MDLNYVKKLVKLLSMSAIDEIEIEEDGKRIRVAKHTQNSSAPVVTGSTSLPAMIAPPAANGVAPAPAPSLTPAAAEAKKLHEIKSPIVGTFYRSPAPDADPYVEVGQVIQPGTVLCIIEAMKLMNEIESDVAGRIVKIHVENGQPVEYNQALFSLEPM